MKRGLNQTIRAQTRDFEALDRLRELEGASANNKVLVTRDQSGVNFGKSHDLKMQTSSIRDVHERSAATLLLNASPPRRPRHNAS